jgi:nonsense-mediated mRNA decay protein 3
MINTTGTAGTILCCLCGVRIEPNEVAMCFSCLLVADQQSTGHTGPVSFGSNEVIQCGECLRWKVSRESDVNTNFMAMEMESAELLSFLLRKTPALQHSKTKGDLKIVDAAFIWTEPHCKRLKVFKEVLH